MDELEQRMVDKPECPHCHSTLINRHGKVDEMQRYRCKNCTKTFMATTGTPFARLRHKELWLDYLRCMLASKVLRDSAAECGINLKTAFRWRHRFLKIPATLKAKKLAGIIEADETLFAYSEKGSRQLSRKPRKRGMKASKPGRSAQDWVPVLMVRDRGQHTFEVVLPHVTTESLTRQLKGKVQKDSVLCSDGYKPYIKFCVKNELIHKRLDVSAGIRVLDKVFHIQNVNAYHSRLKAWMGRFHGVATKYLENYLGWFRYLDAEENLNENRLFRTEQHLIGT
ncbi:IS1595 family transposase [Thalassomonas viridans]|uniref:IS1595 family transposase n=1 Tax=Thalassomonas viridans TaxID=137584 RepID=A0AAE9Z9S7_9GAMM|nr:IS1595 family transposase [Thalassomonas viridans]